MTDLENPDSLACLPDEEFNIENESEYDNEEEDEDDVSLADIMQTFFASEDGKNIVDTLAGLKSSFDIHNKLLQRIHLSLEKLVSKSK